MQVSLQALKVFESAARLGSFKLAAEELSLTPTAISHHINNLEKRLNVDLFYRQVRKTELTEIGKRLATVVSEGFRKIELALEEVKIESHSIRVTTTSSLAAMVLIPSLNEFSKIYSEFSIEIATGESLENHLYTLPIRYGHTSLVPASDIIQYESFNVFSSSKMNMSTWLDKPITLFLTEWKNKALPQPPLDTWLAINGLSHSNIKIKKFDQEIYGIQEALAGHGVVFSSTTLINRLVHNGLIQQVGTKSVRSELCYYIPNKENFRYQHTRPFISWLEELFRSLES